MSAAVSVLILLALFALLGAAADLVIRHLRDMAEMLHIRLASLGLLLGIATSLPEMTLGITAEVRGIPSLSHGNLVGGIIVLLGLVMGIALVIHKKLPTDGRIGPLVPALGLLLLPAFLGFDGRIGLLDGIVLVLSYLAVFFHLFRSAKNDHPVSLSLIRHRSLMMSGFSILVGIVGMLIGARLILDLTEQSLASFGVSPFLIGVFLFAIGTNLPEITIAVRSFRNGSGELSWSGILGSAIVNPLILGILAILRPIPVVVSSSYISLAIWLTVLVIAVAGMYRTDRALTRREGFVLLAIFFGVGLTETGIRLFGL